MKPYRSIIILLAGIFLFLNEEGRLAQAFAQEKNLSAIEAKIQLITQQIQRKYKIKCTYKEIPPPLSAKYLYQSPEEKDYPKLLDYLKIFYPEISKYPRTFFTNKDIKNIYFVKKLFMDQKPAEGLYSYKNKNIYFDFSRNKGNILSKKHSIHHEFYHMMDIMQPGWRDPVWNTFNSANFNYGNDYAYKGEKGRGKTYKIFREHKGFITPYSLKSAEEDKAEIYACLMVQSQNAILRRWMRDDPILKKKAQYIRKRIQEFCPQMDDAYWNELFLDRKD